MTLSRIKTGDPLSALRQNDLIDAVNRLAGARPAAPADGSLVLFEQTDLFTYPETAQQCPYAAARSVWFSHKSETYSAPYARPLKIYFPTAFRYESGDYVGLPLGQVGLRHWCLWNQQSGRWEIVGTTPQMSFFGKLRGVYPTNRQVEVLFPGGRTTDVIVEPECWLLKSPFTLPTSTMVKIEWCDDLRNFMLTGAECVF